MRLNELPFKKCDVFVLGRELEKEELPDGMVRYLPSYRTIHNADVAGSFWKGYPGVIQRIVVSGGYPRAARGMEKPIDDSSEADFMAQRLYAWSVNVPIIPEERSTNTFENFEESRQYLRLGEYNDDDPLVIACNEAHVARAVMLAKYAFNLVSPQFDKSLYLLRPYPETEQAAHTKETALAKLTKLAIVTADSMQFPPGAPGAANYLHDQFSSFWGNDKIEGHVEKRREWLEYVDNYYGPYWHLEDVQRTEIIDYHTAA